MSDDKKQSPITGPGMTVPIALKTASSTYGKKAWMRKKVSGLWHEYSWREGYDKVRHFSLGLTSLGFLPGQTLCIIGDSDPQWFWAEIAAQAAGGSALGLSRSRSAEELKAVIRQFGIKFVAAQDREQVSKLLEIKGDVPSLLKVIYWNTRGIEVDLDPMLVSFDKVAQAGQKLDASQSGSFEERLARIKPSDAATIRCDSVEGSVVQSTTLTHEGLLTAIEGLRSTDHFHVGDRWFSSTQAEGTVEQTLGLAGSLISGMCIEFPENPDTAQQDLREVGSSFVCYPSAIWEAMVATVKDRVEKTTLLKRALAKLAGLVGSRRGDARLKGRKPGVFSRAAAVLAEFIFYRPLKARVGLANTKRVYAFGNELTPGTLRALLDMGLDIRQLEVSGATVALRRGAGGVQADAARKA